MEQQQSQGSQPQYPPNPPTNGGSLQSNIEVHTQSILEESIVNQPELTIGEYLSNPTNVQMMDRLLDEHGDNILASLLMRGIKPPLGFDMS